MKISISLPDPVFAAAEQLARALCVSRSQLYAEAIAEYLERGGSALTAKLNAVYSAHESHMGAEYVYAQAISLGDQTWKA